MIKKIKYNLLLTGIISFLYGCEYTPSDIPLSRVEEPSDEAPSIYVELTPYIDTLRLSVPTWVSYSVETGEHKLSRIEVKIDNESIYDFNYDTNHKFWIYIPVDSLTDGNHQLIITAYTATNTGSIADNVGAEVYWYETKWPIYVNKKAKDNFKFYNINILSKGLDVSWPEYRYLDFDRYEFSWNLNSYKSGNATIINPRLNSYIDSLYVEGLYAYYSIFTYYKDAGTQWNYLDYHIDIKSPNVKVNNDCSIDFQWTHSKFENRVQQYCLETSFKGDRKVAEKEFSNLNDTTFHWNTRIAFGMDYQTQLRYIPKDYTSYHSALNTAGGVVNYAIGDSIPKFENAFNITEENALILYYNKVFTKWDYTTGTVTSFSVSQDIQLESFSPDGSYFGFLDNKEYVVYRSSDMTIVKRLDIEAYDGNYLLLNSVSISDNGLISTSDSNRNIKIFDLNTGNKIFSKQFDVTYFSLKISPDGESLMAMYYYNYSYTKAVVCFSFDGTQLLELGNVLGVGNDVGAIIAYSPQTYKKMIISRWHSSYEYTIEIRDSHTFELLSSFNVPMYYVPMFCDFTTNQVIVQNFYSSATNYSYVIDLVAMQQKKIVQFEGHESKVFINGKVFSGNGRTILLSDYVFE